MIKKVLAVIMLVITSISCAQEGTSSPYSFYGIGLQKFKGTAENRSMGGLSILTDSIHLNLQNPAAYGDLKLTAYTLGVTYNGLNLYNDQGENSYKDNATLDYLAIGIPAGKFGFGFGVIPVYSVGYQVSSISSDGSEKQFVGTGGVNKVFVSAGFAIHKNFSLGLDFNYQFGTIEHKAILDNPDLQFDAREINTSSLSGVSLSFGLTYKAMITDKLQLSTSVVSTPSFRLSSTNTSALATILELTNGSEFVLEDKEIAVADDDVNLPAELKFGGGIGEPKKWFAGIEYTYVDSHDFKSRSFDANNTEQYQNASKFRLGGYYIPNYNSLTSYLSKVVYRAGFRYEETGLLINSQSINEFGISFGIGLPVGNLFSNTNISFEYGERGTTDFGLVKEEFFNISLSLSLNDQWFRKIKFN